MLLLRYFSYSFVWLHVLLDATFVALLIVPICYYLMIRPLIFNIRLREQAEQELRVSEQQLKKRVEDRTAKLASTNKLLNSEIEKRKLNEKNLRDQQEKLRLLSSELMLTEERERRRLAAELHDRIGQNLAVTKIKLKELHAATLLNNHTNALEEIQQFVDQTIKDTRSLTFELSPPVLYELGLEAGLNWLINHVQEKYSIRIKYNDNNQSLSLDDSCNFIVFQAVRELLFNIVKHSRARNAEVHIRNDEGAIRVSIKDDGVGFDVSELDLPAAGSMGFGLFSIRERLCPLGAYLEIESEISNGTCVTIVFPEGCKIVTKGN